MPRVRGRIRKTRREGKATEDDVTGCWLEMLWDVERGPM